jgi:hypothetical protein
MLQSLYKRQETVFMIHAEHNCFNRGLNLILRSKAFQPHLFVFYGVSRVLIAGFGIK